MLGGILRLAVVAVLVLAAGVLTLILIYRWIDPPVTPLMLLRYPAVGRIDRARRPLHAISRDLQYAVIAAEDNRFCRHHGVDWGAVNDAVEEYDLQGRLRGASTITMQLARNLFLWPGGGFFRKGIEVFLALTIDALLPKQRILEIYLNVVEWGDGIYGAEAASRVYFDTSAARLSRRDAALLAAVLPNPRRWTPARPSNYIAERAAMIDRRIAHLERYYDCLR
jgi:monofunctional glycosyltransferase